MLPTLKLISSFNLIIIFGVCVCFCVCVDLYKYNLLSLILYVYGSALDN